MEPLITVIIPMYNAEMYIAKCLESLFRQTYSKIEVVVVDDGSSDNSYSICKEYEKNDSRLRVFHQNNQGVSAARNLALREAKGKYVVFVDADDFVSTEYVHDLWDVVCSTECDLAISRYTTDAYYDGHQDSGKIIQLDSENAIIDMLLAKGFDSSVCCKLMRLDVALEIKFREDLVLAEDMAFFYEIMSKCDNIAFIDRVNYYYIQHETSTISQLSRDKVKSLCVFENLLENSTNINVREALISKYISTCFHLLSLKNDNNIDLSNLIGVIKQYRKCAIMGRHFAIKVKVACILSYVSFSLVKNILSVKRG